VILCLFCEEPILETETNIGGLHTECVKRVLLGSVGHQLGLCCCPGKPGLMDDPPGLSKREATQAAVRQAIAHVESAAKARWN
jgi:hypothetical protein